MIMYVVLTDVKDECGQKCLPVFGTLEEAKSYSRAYRRSYPVLAFDLNGENLLDKESEST